MKIGVAMSGGLDSTVTAAMLLEQGHEVVGYFMLLPLQGADSGLGRVREVAEVLGICLRQVDMRRIFGEKVIDYFVSTYGGGRTPNPCCYCNLVIKFGVLRDHILDDGCDKMATGHYARLINKEGEVQLHRGRDPRKDQSYFLARLTARELDDIVLPLGELSKAQVRRWARSRGLPNTEDPESQDVCFLSGYQVADFLAKQGLTPGQGEVVTRDGRVVGHHKGVFRYTVGQRRGLGIPDATPWYVAALDTQQNRVIVSKKDALLASRLRMTGLRFCSCRPTFPWEGLVQIRSRHQAAPARVIPAAENIFEVSFAKPQSAITPGQLAVMYEGDRVVGSGEII